MQFEQHLEGQVDMAVAATVGRAAAGGGGVTAGRAAQQPKVDRALPRASAPSRAAAKESVIEATRR